MPRSTAIRPKTLHGAIVEQLRELIVDGELGPGQRIPEKELCARFDVSRTPLREALKALAAEGMIELLPQRGARVAIITDRELGELFPIIANIEAMAGEWACASITDNELDAIRTLHVQMVRAYEADDPLEYARLNRAIHFAIFAAARNSSLLAIYRSLELRILNIRHTVRQQPADWERAVRAHEGMIEALAARDRQRMAEIMRQHVLDTETAVRNAIDQLVENGLVEGVPDSTITDP